MDLREIGWNGVDWIDMAEEWDQRLLSLPQDVWRGLSLGGRRDELGAITLNTLNTDMIVAAFYSTKTHAVPFATNSSLHLA
jgi:hypothetical protein